MKSITQTAGYYWTYNHRAVFRYNQAGQFDTIKRYDSEDGTNWNLSVQSTYGYDGAARLSSLVYTNASGNTIYAGYGYQYDDANRIKTFTNSITPTDNRSYAYDGQGQLTDVGYGTHLASADDELYRYDLNGNRTTATVNSTTNNYLLKNAGTSDPGNNQVVDDGQFTYDYDYEGNLVKKTLKSDTSNYTTYIYDYRNRLVEVQNTSGTVHVKYQYDAFDRLIVRQDLVGYGGVQLNQFYVYDGNQIVLTFSGGVDWPSDDYQPTANYLWGPAVDMALAQDDMVNWITGWAITDNENSVHGFAGGTGLTNSENFTAYGQRTGATLHVPQIGAFTGRFYDEATDLQWNGGQAYPGMRRGWAANKEDVGRWYNSSLGRWMSEDPIGCLGRQFNLDEYVGNDPID
jgi:YD repeat-containing protein